MDTYQEIIRFADIRRYSNLLVFGLTACLLCTDTTDGLSLHYLTAPLLTILLMGLATSFLPNKVRQVVQILIGEIIIVVCMVDCYCQLFLLSSISPKILSTILETDHREAMEFLSVFVGDEVFGKWQLVGLLVLAIGFPLSFLYKPDGSRYIWTGKTRYLLTVVFAAVIIYEIPHMLKYAHLLSTDNDQKNTEGLIFRRYQEEVPTPLHRLVYSYHVSKLSAVTLQAIKQATLEATVDNCSHLSPHIVLVIGESYNKHHSSLYGYHLPTTPLQQQREEEGNLFVFEDAVTPWNITSNVFLDQFSTCGYGQDGMFSTYPLFPVLFRRAGYHVRFFSNQYLLKGFRKGATNQAGNFFLSDRELSDTLFDYRHGKSSRYDMGFVRQVATYREEHREVPFTLDIIHLVGQHFDYSRRYPRDMAKFTVKEFADRGKGKEASQVMMHYDNATYYNDMVVDSIMHLYDNQEAVVIYVADHGEEVYDDLPVSGRLHQKPTKQIARQEFEVPMWIWCSKKYQEAHGDVVVRLREYRKRPFISSDISQMLFHLAGLRCKWYDECRDILSPQYKVPKRIIAGEVDYDSFYKTTYIQCTGGRFPCALAHRIPDGHHHHLVHWLWAVPLLKI